jgi:hypothetical protein
MTHVASTSGLSASATTQPAPVPPSLDPPEVPPGFPPPVPASFLSVPYDHYRFPDGSDLYVTPFGRPLLPFLHPSNWYEPDWFRKSREKLQGTSRVYRVSTKPVAGRRRDLVVKWCRVGEEVPMDTFTLNKFIEAEFNSPYEEFSLLLEMRRNARPRTLLTHKPLAIYVPAKRFELWQTGRSQSKIATKKAKFRDVELDIYRQYILIYEWIKGVAATSPEAAAAAANDPDVPPEPDFPAQMLRQSIADMWKAGFRVLDVKPQHVIVRPDPRTGALLRTPTGAVAYALVDFELLARTPEHETAVKQSRRQNYLERQRNRFSALSPFPPHLHPVGIFGVDYVHGPCESTGGRLWVVGHDPALFDYFQPERWRRTPRTSLSDSAQVYSTTTKDGIHLVWKVAHVGEPPDPAATSPALAALGYNSPFEEIAYALRLAAAGVPTTYPRAIYMLGHLSTLPPDSLDPSRYRTHADIRNPDGSPALLRERNYIVIWGYWNGTDEVLAASDAPSCSGIDAARAAAQGLIPADTLPSLIEKARLLLASAGFQDLLPLPSHFLLTLLPDGTLLRDPDSTPALRFCTFETLRPLA